MHSRWRLAGYQTCGPGLQLQLQRLGFKMGAFTQWLQLPDRKKTIFLVQAHCGALGKGNAQTNTVHGLFSGPHDGAIQQRVASA